MYKIAVLDDDLEFLKQLKQELKKYEEFVSFTYYLDPIKLLEHANKYDGLLTDFEMPNLNAFELFEELEGLNKKLEKVIISNYDGYVFKSFKFGIFWYMKKKDFIIEIHNMMNKLLNTFKLRNTTLSVETINRAIDIPFSDIMYISSDKNYVLIHADQVYRIRSTFSAMFEKVVDNEFALACYGVAVNLNNIRFINKTTGVIMMKDMNLITISSKRAKQFMADYIEFKLQ